MATLLLIWASVDACAVVCLKLCRISVWKPFTVPIAMSKFNHLTFCWRPYLCFYLYVSMLLTSLSYARIVSSYIMLYHITPCNVILYRFLVSYYKMSYYTISYQNTSYHTSYQIKLYYIILYHIILYNIILYHITLYHIIQYDIILHHIILYYMM